MLERVVKQDCVMMEIAYWLSLWYIDYSTYNIRLNFHFKTALGEQLESRHRVLRLQRKKLL